MATEIEEALHAECKRLAARVKTLETEGREEFHRILADITGQLDEARGLQAIARTLYAKHRALLPKETPDGD